MKEQMRALSIGFALVDEKIRRSDVTLPQQPITIDTINTFLDTQDTVTTTSGGSIANTVSTYAKFIAQGEARLFYSVGDDNRGEIFRQETSAKLGQPQVDPSRPTGTCVFVIGENGEPLDEINVYGAAESVVVSKSEVDAGRNDLFIANVNALRRESVSGQAEPIMQALERDGGIFALRLSGAHSTFVQRADLLSFFSSLKNDPDLIFANKDELRFTLGDMPVEQAIHRAFPNSRLLVLTLGKEGSVVRFEGNTIAIPPHPVAAGRVIDVAGAGDSYMGVMLGSLGVLPYSRWTAQHVEAAAKAGTYAASLAIQTLRSRLTDAEVTLTRNYFHSLTAG